MLIYENYMFEFSVSKDMKKFDIRGEGPKYKVALSEKLWELIYIKT